MELFDSATLLWHVFITKAARLRRSMLLCQESTKGCRRMPLCDGSTVPVLRLRQLLLVLLLQQATIR